MADPYKSPDSIAKNGKDTFRSILRVAVGAIAIVTSLSVLVLGLILACLQLMLDEAAYARLILGLANIRLPVLALPAFFGLVVVIATLVDVLLQRKEFDRSTTRAMALIVVFNVVGVMAYWMRELSHVGQHRQSK